MTALLIIGALVIVLLLIGVAGRAASPASPRALLPRRHVPADPLIDPFLDPMIEPWADEPPGRLRNSELITPADGAPFEPGGGSFGGGGASGGWDGADDGNTDDAADGGDNGDD